MYLERNLGTSKSRLQVTNGRCRIWIDVLPRQFRKAIYDKRPEMSLEMKCPRLVSKRQYF